MVMWSQSSGISVIHEYEKPLQTMKQYLNSNCFIPSTTDLSTTFSSLRVQQEGISLYILNLSKTHRYISCAPSASSSVCAKKGKH